MRNKYISLFYLIIFLFIPIFFLNSYGHQLIINNNTDLKLKSGGNLQTICVVETSFGFDSDPCSNKPDKISSEVQTIDPNQKGVKMTWENYVPTQYPFQVAGSNEAVRVKIVELTSKTTTPTLANLKQSTSSALSTLKPGSSALADIKASCINKNIPFTYNNKKYEVVIKCLPYYTSTMSNVEYEVFDYVIDINPV